jgi:DNA helicase-2/ATP-dependent DNA helicase PcrA
MAGCPIWDLLADPVTLVQQINRGTADKLLQFRRLLEGYTELAHETNVYNLAVHILQTSGILEEFRYDRTPEGLSKFENIQELVNGLREYAEQPADDESGANGRNLDHFLQNVSLLTDQDQEKPEDRNKVSLMTIHSAKGLEFGYVFIAGVEEELFPSQFSTGTAKEIEEERRLFYVAITRAMKRVTISHARTRYRWGNLVDTRPSRFIREIDTKYLKMGGSLEHWGRSEPGSRPEPSESLLRPPLRRIVPVKASSPAMADEEDFAPDDPDQIQSGMKVKHPRFGSGRVLQIEGEGHNRKATVFFTESGQKQLLLRFARLKILPN